MAITAVDKIKLKRYLNEHAVGDIYYLDMCDALGKRNKISDVEFLDYFTDYVVKEFRKDTKISIKYLTKIIFVIDTFLSWIHEAGSSVKEETLDKIRNFNDFYLEYLSRCNLDKDIDFSDNCINIVLNTVNKLYPSDVKSESVAKHINKTLDLEEDIKKLNHQLKHITNLYDNLKDSYNQKTNLFETLNEENISLGIDNRSKEMKIVELNTNIESLASKILELENLASENQEEIKILTKYKEKYDELNQEILKLRKIIEDEKKLKQEAIDLKIKESKIEALIYQKLLFESATIDDIEKFIYEQNFDISREGIINLLKRIRSKINISNNTFSQNPIYRINVPNISKNGEFLINIPNDCKHYDIMLVSDFHIKEFNEHVLNGFDILNNYCVKNGINLILNLGDFYHGFGNKTLDYENAIKNYELIEKSFSLIPKQDNLYHAILGGNHDKNIASYGFDPIKILTDEREDFLNLGYTNSIIKLNNLDKELGRFGIHHPDTFSFPLNFNDDGINTSHLNNYLNETYKNSGKNRDNSYIDILGHTHKNQFNYPNSYCYITSFFDDEIRRGACHLRIYFDNKKGINYMLFMPLSINHELVKNNEIVYQKVLNK